MPYSPIASALLTLLALPLAAVAAPADAAAGAAASPQGVKALYFMTDAEENAVVAVPIGPDGKLAGGTSTPTGGRGAVSVDGMTNAPAAKDPLVSQGSLSVAGNHLFVANAGSNTISMFAICARDPSKLALVGEPAAMPGEFVNTVAASAKNKMVCAGSTGAKSGVSCASFDAQNGIGKMDGLRDFALGQSTPPVGPPNTLSQVFWSNDESTLFATVKGDPAKNATGFLSAFSIEAQGQAQAQGQGSAANANATGPSCRSGSGGGSGKAAALAQQDVRSSPDGTAVLFGSLPIPDSNNIFATDASFGAAVLSLDDKRKASVVGKQAIEGQTATCWATLSPNRRSALVTDVGTAKLVEMSLKDASIMQTADLADTGATGLIDLRTAGDFVYALAPGVEGNKTQILVVGAGCGQKLEPVQQFDVEALGAGALSQGMAIFEQ